MVSSVLTYSNLSPLFLLGLRTYSLFHSQVYDPFANVRHNGPKERRLFRRAMMGEYDYRKFPEQPKLTREEVKDYIQKKKAAAEAKIKIASRA
mgnify:CR=1 FL=1